jgi:hypothetical protein
MQTRIRSGVRSQTITQNEQMKKAILLHEDAGRGSGTSVRSERLALVS